jgi:hypothetical protein
VGNCRPPGGVYGNSSKNITSAFGGQVNAPIVFLRRKNVSKSVFAGDEISSVNT